MAMSLLGAGIARTLVAAWMILGVAPGLLQARVQAPRRGSQGAEDTRATPPRPGEWWADNASRARLLLTDVQSRKIDEIVRQLGQQNGPLERLVRDAFARLDAMVAARSATPNEIRAQSLVVETARAAWRVNRTVAIYQIDALLSDTQRKEIEAMHGRGGTRANRPDRSSSPTTPNR